MRKIALVLLFLIVISTPVFAFSVRDGYLDTVVAIAWLDGRTLNVALGNTGNTRTTVTVSTSTVDTWGRPVFASRQVSVPGRTIVVESITPSTPGRNEDLNVKVAEGYRSTNVRVQKSDLMQADTYIVPANTDWQVATDLAFLMQEPKGASLVIDKFYEIADGQGRGPIHVESFEGGLKYVRSTNTIEYVRPYLVLSMKTPQTTGLTALTFGMRKIGDGYGWRYEEIQGPTILVYGRNIRFAGASSSGSNESTRVPR